MPSTPLRILRLDSIAEGPRLHLTSHAHRRMQRRRIQDGAIDAVLDYGRVIYTRGAVIHAIGRNEIAYYAREGIDLAAFDGVQVVCALDGVVLTVYRNRNFRGLRTGLGRGRCRCRRLKRA